MTIRTIIRYLSSRIFGSSAKFSKSLPDDDGGPFPLKPCTFCGVATTNRDGLCDKCLSKFEPKSRISDTTSAMGRQYEPIFHRNDKTEWRLVEQWPDVGLICNDCGEEVWCKPSCPRRLPLHVRRHLEDHRKRQRT